MIAANNHDVVYLKYHFEVADNVAADCTNCREVEYLAIVSKKEKI